MMLINGECIEEMRKLPSGSVDSVICDPPYGTTACKWDNVIDFEEMWEELFRVLKPNGVICLCSAQPFTSALIMSNVLHFKYSWTWVKNKATGHLNAKKQPLRATEDVCVFYKKQPTYNPQGLVKKDKPTISKGNRGTKGAGSSGEVYGLANKDAVQTHTGYPRTTLEVPVVMKPIHSTQKPVELMEYLIKTYTNEGETVLDFTMGSGTTGVACVNTNRNFIGIELDENYFRISRDRIDEAMGI